MNLSDIIGAAADYTAIPFAIVGFGITFWQLRKTKRAAEAARDSAQNAQKAITRSSLLVLIPQLQRVEEELERAIRQESADLALSWLANWRWQANQVRGLLEVAALGEPKLMRALQASVSRAAVVKGNLIDGGTENLRASTKPARDAIAKVTNELSVLATLYGSNSGEHGNDSR